MENIQVLQKIRTYVKNKGIVDFFISKELNSEENIFVKQEITKIESYPINKLKNRPIRFVYFCSHQFYILLQSKYLQPVDTDNRIGNFITHSIILKNKVKSFNPIDFFHSKYFNLDYDLVVNKHLFNEKLSFSELSNSIIEQKNEPNFSEQNKQLLSALMLSYRENKSIITISNDINPILKGLFTLLPINIRQDITFSNLEFTKISAQKVYNIYNYSEYSLSLAEMNSYEEFNEVMKDANKLNYMCFNYEDEIFPNIADVKSRYINFIFNNPSKIDIFYNFAEQYRYSFSELDLLTLLFEYEISHVKLSIIELKDLISFVKQQKNKELFKKLFVLIQSKQDYSKDFEIFIYFIESFEEFFSNEELIKIIYDGVEKALGDINYDINLLFKKLFTVCKSGKELRELHGDFVDRLAKENKYNKTLKSILPFNRYTFDILKFELKDNYFEFISNVDKHTLLELMKFYENKRFPKSIILAKFNQQDVRQYLFLLLENGNLSLQDLANYGMNKEIKDYFVFKRDKQSSKTFFNKLFSYQNNELSILEEFGKKLVMNNDVLPSLVEITILNNKLNFDVLVELYSSYSKYDQKNKNIIFKNLDNILEKKFSMYYNKIDFLEDELYSSIKQYPYLSTGIFINKINKNCLIDFKDFELEENYIPLKIIKKSKLDKKILKMVQKEYNDTINMKDDLTNTKLIFEDLLKLQVFQI